MFKKASTALLISVLSITSISTTALASENGFKTNIDSDFETKASNIDSNVSNNLTPVDIEYTTQALIVEMGKPIKFQGKVPNSYLKVIVDNYDDKSLVMSVLSSLLLYKGVTAPAGLIAGLTVPISRGGIRSISDAYARGDDMYLVTVYASGVNPSLSTISYRYFSKTPIKFIQ